MGASSAVASKVSPPSLPPHLVPRPRLAARLNGGARGPLTLVSAGPGSGKTVLLSSWVASVNMPTAWLSLEAPDNDSKRLWPMVGEALLAAGIVGETDSFATLPHDPGDTSRFLSALLEAIPGPAQHLLVIDDAHVLTDGEVLAEIDAIIRYGFPRLRLVLSSRSDPLLPLHRYRLSGQICELRASDLAMTRSETQTLLNAYGVTLPGRELALLTQRTEGWTAGLRLSAMSMAGSKHPERFVTQLALDQGSVGEYLMEEVLNRQPSRVRRLLVQTSFLDEVTGPLATAVTGIDDSSVLLNELSRTNSFVLPLDRDTDRYRYHQLLNDILRYLLRREYPDETAELQRRAAAWYEAQGDLGAAMRFAVAAEDWNRASAVLVHGGFARAFVERQDIIDLGLGGLTTGPSGESIADFDEPEVRVARAAVAVMSGELQMAEQHLVQARSAELRPDVEATAALVEVVAAHQAGTVAELDRAAAQLLSLPTKAGAVRSTVGLRAAVRLGQASAHYWDASPHAEVEKLLLDVLDLTRKAGVPALELECQGLLQLAYTNAGRSEHARMCEAQSLALIRQFPHLRRLSVHHLAHAYAAYLKMDLAGADRALRRARQRMHADADASMRAAIVLLGLHVLIAAGRVPDAYQQLLTAPELARPLPALLKRTWTLTRADIETRLGRPNAALKLLTEDPVKSKDTMLTIMAARAYLKLGDADAACRSIRPVLISAENNVPLPMLLSALLTSASVAARKGNDAKAVEEILRAADLGTEYTIQPFTDVQDELAGVLSRHAEARAAWPEPVTGSMELSQPPAGHPATGPLPEALTEREIAVLRRLATTMTTAEISNELCVSINTVKTHIAAIYRKLPAAGRRDAVSRARYLELL
ncbi:LuxR C-terminal-related transcriptional regulator [Jatrophihabitans sp. DSM 45814]